MLSVLLILFAGVICTASAQQTGCPTGHFQCTSGQCISASGTCNGYPNCQDGSDEEGCVYPECEPNTFQCPNSPSCIPEAWLCNGFTECINGEDEDNCPDVPCTSEQFTCVSTGRCIYASWQCDYWDDCGDNSDEVDCDFPSCAPGEFQCKYGSCINESQVCNAEIDCYDGGSDESNCTFATCLPQHTACQSGECLPAEYKCNHYAQCWDASDEVNCTHAECQGSQYRCNSGQCIPTRWVCDGILDCSDRSDEEKCVGTFSCPPGQWPCSRSLRKCVDVNTLCDSHNDCPDAEDEDLPCNSRSCGYLSCEYQCHSAPNGGTCYCQPGFVISSDNRTCEDFDECNHWGYCAHGCQNEASTYQCSCEEGYMLEGDGMCRSIATDVPYLLVTSGQTITRSNLNGEQKLTIATVPDSITPENLDFHFSLRKIFWTSEKGVHSSNFMGGNPTEPEVVFAVPERITIAALAVDWIGSKLYMAERLPERILVSELDGTNSASVISYDIHTVSALAVDPVNGYLFFGSGSRYWWRDEQHLKLERSFMDGSHRAVLATEKVYSISGIALDIPTKRVFWIDQSYDFMNTVTYDGHHRYTILQGFQVIPSPQSLAVFERFAFIADHTRDAVLRADRYDWSSDVTIRLPVTEVEPKGVSVYHSSQQPSVPNPCGSNNGGCEHLCVVSHRSDNHGLGYKCMCRSAYRLNEDETTCSEITSFLLGYSYVVMHGISLNFNEENLECIEPIVRGSVESSNSYDLYVSTDPVIDAESRYIYHVRRGGVLRRVKTDGTGGEDFNIGHFYPRGMSYDWLSKNLYWKDLYYDVIAVLKLDGDFTVETVVNDNAKSFSNIQVAPLAGYLFWYNYDERKIERFWLDGSHREDVITGEIGGVRELRVDHQTSMLYWISYSGVVWQANLDGGSRTIVDLGVSSFVYSMAINNGIAYLSSYKGNILTLNVSSGYPARVFGKVRHSHLMLYSLEIQTSVENICSRNGGNSDCSHFCFPAPSNQRTCGCPINMRLMADQRTCEDDPNPENPWSCKPEQQCDDGTCLHLHLICDGFNDCPNNEDERNCSSCSRFVFECEDGSGCVPWPDQCDQVDDCADGSDEENCGNTCDEDSFHCADGSCIPQRWVCDTNTECPDGSDEINCEDYTCPPDHFTCESGSLCLPERYVCDGFNQCPDLSDEANCGTVNCSRSYWANWACANGYECISPRYVCDGQYDCGDWSDEKDCDTYSTSCSQWYITCASTGTCISKRWQCDGVADCEDGSDEPSDCGEVTCEGFACSAYTCIAQNWVCDGENDCADASDEENCPVPEFACPAEHWQCPDTTQCVPFASVCDQSNDCPNGEDEGSDCNSDECSIFNGQCSHICLQTPFGAACECPAGYQLSNPKECVDFDECTVPDSCSQACTNARGSFICQCADGYLLEPNRRTCKASDPSTPYLILTARQSVRKYNLHTGVWFDVMNDRSHRVFSADFDASTGYIYYAEAESDSMYKTNINGTDTEEVFGNGIQAPTAMAVDWVGRNVYWMDSIMELIEVASLDRNHRSVLISQNISLCNGLCVDPTEGSRYIFWVARSRNPRIERASMDGTDRQVIISEDLQDPYGLTVDLPTKKLYFGDKRLDFIDSCNYDGTGRRRVLVHSTQFTGLIALTIFEDYIYWINSGSGVLLKAKKFNGENKTVISPWRYFSTDLHVFHPAIQPTAANPCVSNPCTHLCVLSSNDPGFSCLCPAGQDLQTDGTCRRVGPFLMVIQRGLINGISLDPDDQSLNQMQAIATEYDAFDLDFDETGGFIYWSESEDQEHDEEDSALRSIMRAEVTGINSSEIFVPTAYLGSPVGIALDHLSRNIYWTNPDKHTIEVIKLDGESNYRRVVVQNSGDSSRVADPDAICLDPGSGMMYWAENGGVGVQPGIMKANMDGTGIQSLVTTNLGHIDFITIDLEQHMLYWSESTNQVIERCNVDGTNRLVLVTDVHHPMGVAVYENFLYYTDSAFERIMRVNKNDGSSPTVMRTGIQDLKALRVSVRVGPTSNGCSQSNGGCQHICLPTGPTSRTCACSIGFIINSDDVTCGSISSFAVVSQFAVTRGFGLDGNEHPEAMVPIAGRHTKALDVHVAEEFIYFVDNKIPFRYSHVFYWYPMVTGIQRIKPDGSGYQEIVGTGVGTGGIQGIAVDWIAGNLYWTNAFGSVTYLEVSRLDGSQRLVLQKITHDNPGVISVNPHKKYLYWADSGQFPRIVRAFLDGSNQTDLATIGVVHPCGITIDIQTHDVLWVDRTADVLEKMDWQGGNRRIIRSGLPNPTGVAVFRDSVYWLDGNLEKVFQASKLPGSDKEPDVFHSNLEDLQAIAIFDARNQLSSNDNACGVNNGGCEQLCLAMPADAHVAGDRVCRCYVAVLASDGFTCQNATSFLILSFYKQFVGVNFDATNHNSPINPIVLEQNMECFAVHDASQRIYFITAYSVRKLMSVPVHGGQAIEIKDFSGVLSSYVRVMQIDWLHDRLYLVHSLQISAIDLDGNNLVHVVTSTGGRVYDFGLDPCRGMMYWLSNSGIFRSSMGGRQKEKIIDIQGRRWKLIVDSIDQKLYWKEGIKLMRSDLDGNNQDTLVENADISMTMRSMVIHGNYLYFTGYYTLSKMEKDTGADQTVIHQHRDEVLDDLQVYNGERPVCTASSCSIFNGGCSHTCHPGMNGGVDCLCPFDLVIANNGRVCVPPTASCGVDEFTCANGNKCIPVSWECDIDDDCGDNSDEGTNYCFDHTCESTEFMCTNGRCVPSSFICDYDNDCRDNSDEVNCEFPTCPGDDYTCPNGRCIPQDYLCDGYDDCRDGNYTDERNCPEMTCVPPYVSCPFTSICIHPHWRCDGDNDCVDNGDENPLFCQEQNCPTSSFRCDSGQCVSGFWLCDGGIDCQDGSDEDDVTCTHPDFTCTTNYFKCDNNRCIPDSWVCDSDNDCGDDSDEDGRHNCDTHECAEEFFTCAQNRPGRNRCIPMNWVCDGDSDCEHADDEHNCTRTPCADGEFTCGNGLCIASEWECDHDNDCGDQSDEGGHCDYPECTISEFTCNNGRCIRASWTCDGDNDCRDYSDEQNCVTPPVTCPPDNFMCIDGTCIAANLVCDKNNHCSDMSDEQHCDINECDNLEANQCQHVCTDTLTSFVCSCNPGFRLNADTITCSDINECEETPAVCSQQCENTHGSYICKCADGYAIEPNAKSCKHISGGDPSLIFSNRYYIRELSVDGTQYDLLKEGLIQCIALDFDIVEDRLYFLDVGTDQIMRMFINGSDAEVIVPYQVSSGQGLAVDWVGRKLYWLEGSKDIMEVSELDGSSRKTINWQDMVYPRAVTVDPRNGYVYWTDWGLSSYIGRMGMDGNNPQRIITEKLIWPNGLTICYAANKIFWIDAHLNYIGFANLDGSSPHELPGQDLAHPFALSVFEDFVYWTDWNTKAIYKADKFSGEGVTMLRETVHRPFDIHVHHPLRQDQSIANPCGANNGGCSHLCLIAIGGITSTCACPDNFIFTQGSRTTCVANCSVLEFRCADDNECIPKYWKCDGETDCNDGSDEPDSCPVRHCHLGFFQCDNLQCTAGQTLCDGTDDCGDNSDEVMCDSSHCKAWEFRCDSGNCILHNQACDGVSDCLDGSDEKQETCTSRTCSPGFFQCNTGYCIPESWVCDFDDDCGDMSDEPHRECQRVTCAVGWEPCTTNYRCIPSWAVCNGVDNCRDNSDEVGCEQRTCASGEFRCDETKCIPGQWLCDFTADCDDGTDEDETCLHRECSESEFRCATNQCIPNRWVCDHDDDCGDLSDELACLNYECLPGSYKCTSGHCINEDYVCDGERDCLDFSDEVGCSTRLPGGLYCFATQFTCNNTLCIREDWVCDGEDDCGDGSDESLFACANNVCDTSKRFKCNNNRCIPQWFVCDDVDDCGDGSDENNHDVCQAEGCASDQFKCTNNECIPAGYVCDLEADCSDLSDEHGCHSGSCAMGSCEMNCTNLDDGHFCSCQQGYKLTDDRLGCEDNDECLDNPCTQKCTNFKGGYRCECIRGYNDRGDKGIDCKAEGVPKVVVFTDGPEIRRFEESEYTNIIIDQGAVHDVDFDVTSSALYWVDKSLGAVVRALYPTGLDQKITTQTIVENINQPLGISVDWASGNIYWLDFGDKLPPSGRSRRDTLFAGPRIAVSKVDGRYIKNLITTGLDKPTAIAVNPHRGVMYWTDTGDSPKIEMSWMNGEGRQVLVTEQITNPTGITIDFANYDTVYFCDNKDNVIESMRWDGQQRKILKSGSSLENPLSLDVFETLLHFTTERVGISGKIRTLDKLGRGVPTTLVERAYLPGGLVVYHEKRYTKDLVGACKGNPCSHLCLLIPTTAGNQVTNGYKCGCPNDDVFKSGSEINCLSAKAPPLLIPGLPDCRCKNGGTCIDKGKCQCTSGFEGDTCSTRSAFKGGPAGGAVAAPIVIIILIIIAAVVGFLFYRRRSMNGKPHVDSSVSYRGGANIEMPGQTPAVDGDVEGNTHFANPVYATSVQSPALQAVGNGDQAGALPMKVAIGGDQAGPLPEKTGLPDEEELDLRLQKSYSPAEGEGDTKTLVTKD
ncbi:low-density lipoprotein receptor-related protein 2-like isoform X2 [Asterias rubens]|uniref:low-density lipoprotein receptor-related protein 2-like isoform X2 n=1 Tax=Asterias rubens TaxID=7604 RepID=UPI001454E5BC|nr:low-density lipoprotein receptor-related protein 2-like isoform X2 [Asterias rubens]